MRHDDDKRESFDDKYRRHAHELDQQDTTQFDRVEDTKEENNREDTNDTQTETIYKQDKEKKKSDTRPALVGLLAGLLGALIMLVGYHYMFSETNEPVGQSKNTEEVREALEKDNENKVVTDTIVAVEKAKPAVVSVLNLQRQTNIFGADVSDDLLEAGTGSGVIYKVDNNYAYVITNHHVIDNASGLQVNTSEGKSIEAELIGTDVWTDLAVLRIPKGDITEVIEFGDSDALLVGEEAIAIGSPLGDMFHGSVSRGIVSALERAVPVDIDGDGNVDWEATVIQTDAAINPGNSGGALVNSNGELIGINSMKIGLENVEGIGFAIPSNDVKNIIKELEENGEVDRPFIGVSLIDLYMINVQDQKEVLHLPSDVTDGAVISDVQAGSAADKVNIPELAVVTKLDDEEIHSAMEFRQYLYGNKKTGDTIKMTYYYDGKEYSKDIQL